MGDITHLNNNLSPTLSNSISLQKFPETIDTNNFTEWLEDMGYDKNIEIEDFLKYNEPIIVTDMDSTEVLPSTTETRIDYNDKEAMIKPLNLESKSQIKDNAIHNDIKKVMDSILNKLEGSMQKSNIESTSSLLPKNIDIKLSQNLSSIMPQKSNLILKKRKSIEMKIQESRKRLKVLRVQNTLLMNRKLLTEGMHCEVDTLQRFIRTTSLH